MVTLFGRYVFYDVLEIWQHLTGSEKMIKLGWIRFWLSIQIVSVSGLSYAVNYENNIQSLKIPFRINGILVLISSFIVPIIYSLSELKINTDATSILFENDFDNWNIKVDQDQVCLYIFLNYLFFYIYDKL